MGEKKARRSDWRNTLHASRDTDIIPTERICDAYRLGRFISASRSGGSRNLCHVFHTSTGKWFVRRKYSTYCNEERIKFDHAAMLYLMNAGVPVKPPLISSAGKSWWHDGENVWEAFKFVEGQPLHDGSEQDTAFLGTALGNLHRSGTDFKLRYEKSGIRGETDPERLMANAERLKKDDPGDPLSHMDGSWRRDDLVPRPFGLRSGRLQPRPRHYDPGIDPILAPYERLIAQAMRDLPPDAYLALPHTLVHGDVQPANVIMGEDGVRAFVDFDWCAWRPRIYDLAFAILFCCSFHERPIGKGDIWALTQTPDFNAKATESFMNAYEKNSGALSDAERKYLGPQMALAWCHALVDGAFKVPIEERRNFLSRPAPKDDFFALIGRIQP